MWLYVSVVWIYGEQGVVVVTAECGGGRKGWGGCDLVVQCAAEGVLTWVEDLNGGVGVRMLLMDHLSAYLLCQNL